MAKDLYEIGEIPPLGEIRRRMHAQLGPARSLRRALGRDRGRGDRRPRDRSAGRAGDVMAAGVNFNNVWAVAGSRST